VHPCNAAPNTEREDRMIADAPHMISSELFDEQDDAVEWMIRTVIEAAHGSDAKVGLCGQAPSDHAAFAEFLVACGTDSMSVSPDSFIAVKRHGAAAEAERRDTHAAYISR
jgi:pyruvate,water dikinase